MPIVLHTTRHTPGLLGAYAYSTLEYEHTAGNHRVMRVGEDGHWVFRRNSSVVYIGADGAVSADIAPWAEAAQDMQSVYGCKARDREVYTHTYTISWHPLDEVDPDQAIAIARDFADRFLSGHGALCAVHFDARNKHVHIVISAWRERDVEHIADWMQRGADGEVLPSEVVAGGKHHCSEGMRRDMNDYCYAVAQAHGWVAVDFNALIDENRAQHYDQFTAALRDTLCFLTDCASTVDDFKEMLSLYQMRIVRTAEGNYAVVAAGNGWRRTFSEMGLSIKDLRLNELDGRKLPLSPVAQRLRAACLTCIPQSESLAELSSRAADYQVDVTVKDGVPVARDLLSTLEMPLDTLGIEEDDIRQVCTMSAQETKDVDSLLRTMPQQEQISYVLMLADEVRGTDALCRELYDRYRAMTDTDEILEQYWRVYFSALDLFWAAYKKSGEEAWERHRAAMDSIYKLIQRSRENLEREQRDACTITTGALAVGVFIEPVFLAAAVLFFAVAVLFGVKAREEEDYLLAVQEERKEHFELERIQHKNLAKKAMRQDLSLIERYELLRQLESEHTATYTRELLEDMQEYTRTPTRKKRAPERER